MVFSLVVFDLSKVGDADAVVMLQAGQGRITQASQPIRCAANNFASPPACTQAQCDLETQYFQKYPEGSRGAIDLWQEEGSKTVCVLLDDRKNGWKDHVSTLLNAVHPGDGEENSNLYDLRWDAVQGVCEKLYKMDCGKVRIFNTKCFFPLVLFLFDDFFTQGHG